METVVVKILGFICIIALGYFARVRGIVKPTSGVVIGSIVMNITLPCSLIVSMNGTEFTASILIAALVGFVASVMLVGAAYLRARKFDNRTCALEMINTGGYNMGNFAIPFVSSFFPAAVVPYVCLFDSGNAIMTLGGTASFARGVLSGNTRLNVGDFLRVLFRSVAFDTYVVLVILSIFSIQLPEPVVTIAGMIGNANTFLAMFMVGVMLNVHIDRSSMGSVVRILTTRYVAAIVFSILGYLFLPLPLAARQGIVLAFLSPLANVNAIYSAQMKLDDKVPAAVMTLSIFISTFLMSVMTIVFSI